ncbi:MAG: flippase-like domain-containing protein, partial [Flavobacteriales bacterium]|nr:flippase-like domain-containing protein [Flavobacteriales bacterium]
MKTNNLYKYINLLLRIIIGVVAIGYIFIKLKDEFFLNLQVINGQNIIYSAIVITIFLLFVNWGIEAFKWRYAISKVERISFKKAFKLTLTGITLGIITPNRVGEIPARALLLNRNSFNELTLKTLVSSFSQVIITFFVGIVGLITVYDKFNL